MSKIFLRPEYRVAEALARDGYAHLDDEFFGGRDPDLKKARTAFAESCRELPKDGDGGNSNRNRRYGNLVLLPWSWTLEPVPPVWSDAKNRHVSTYFQSSQINPQDGGKTRSFAPLAEEQQNSSFLKYTIMACFRSLRWKYPRQPVLVGVHLIQLTALPNAPGVSSPDLIHQDGEPYTFAALVERYGIVGGENLITIITAANKHPSAVPDDAVIERFTLDEPWHGWVVDDSKVAHYVSKIELAQGHQRGARTIILIDFTPMVPDIHGYH
jgi:hypothetical protein